MSNEIKGVSFRLGEEDIQKFREFAEEQGLNQAEMFQAMINNFEIARAKNSFSDRAKEIETFQVTVNTLIGMFVNSLAINQTSEDRIRETLGVELSTKDKTISNLQCENDRLKSMLDKAEKNASEYFDKYYQVSKLAETLQGELGKKDGIISSLQEQITTLNSIVAEYKGYKEEHNRLEKKLQEAELKNAELHEKNVELHHANLTLTMKANNLEELKDFYAKQLSIVQANQDNEKDENNE